MATHLHDRQRFFKYSSLATALRVAESRSFRWTAPTLFNDPFDHQTGFVMNYEHHQLARLLAESIERVLFGNQQPIGEADSIFAAMLLRLRAIRDRLPREQVMQELQLGCAESAARLPDQLHALNSMLRRHLCNSRVFCISEIHDNVVMWAHYADEHRGAVFSLRCIDELDNRLLAARKVEYTDAFLRFPSADVYARHLTGEQPFDLLPLIWQIAFTKHRDWSYEREWRVHLPLRALTTGEGHMLLDEDPRVFEAIYLGCRATDQDVERMLESVKAHLPRTKVFRAIASSTAFALDFKELYAGS